MSWTHFDEDYPLEGGQILFLFGERVVVGCVRLVVTNPHRPFVSRWTDDRPVLELEIDQYENSVEDFRWFLPPCWMQPTHWAPIPELPF